MSSDSKKETAMHHATPSPPLDDASVARLWSGIGSRRRSLVRQRQGAKALIGAAFVSALALLFLAPRSARIAVEPAIAPGPIPSARASESIHLANGTTPAVLAATAVAQRFALDDGSVVELASGARFSVLANTGSAFMGRLEGSATFDVKPGGARRWSVVADLVSVDVIGTRFQVLEDADADGLRHDRVVVDHGIVLVRGDDVPGHFQRLLDGQTLTVSASTAPAVSGPMATRPVEATKAAALAAKPREDTWRELARGGDYAAAYGQLGADGVGRLARVEARSSVDDLLMLADVARLSAHGAEAVAPLTNVLNDHARDARAGVAAFTLGRLELDTLGHPARAATAFARAIALGLPDGLIEDAYARLVEADAKSGDVTAARAVADEYARKYPQGTRSSTMSRWVAGASSPAGHP
jgi:transmembrane sensor